MPKTGGVEERYTFPGSAVEPPTYFVHFNGGKSPLNADSGMQTYEDIRQKIYVTNFSRWQNSTRGGGVFLQDGRGHRG